MTLVVALKAADGVALVSDGQATSEDSIGRTRTAANKLFDLHGKLAFGCSGDAGLEQRVVRALTESVSLEDCSLPIEELRSQLLSAVNAVQKQAVEEHVHLGDGALPAHVAVLFAGFSGGEPWVYEIGITGKDEVHPSGEAIGHARHFPHYLMVSTLHYRLQDRGVELVKVLAYRAVMDAIKADATALGFPIHAYIVTEHGAERLQDDRQKAIADALNGWKQQEHDIFRDLLSEAGGDGPDGSDDGEPAPGVQP
jgi:20S proteasome alpha/beta subunit